MLHCMRLCTRCTAVVSYHPIKIICHKNFLLHRYHGNLADDKSERMKSKMTVVRRYGLAFILVDTCTWAISIAAISLLIFSGADPSMIMHKVQYLSSFVGWNASDISPDDVSKAASLSLGYTISVALTPFRLIFDLFILKKLKRKGIIKSRKR